MGKGVWLPYGGVGAAEAADAPVCSSVEPEEGEDVDVEAVAHGSVLLVVHPKEDHVAVRLCDLADLEMGGGRGKGET